MDKVAKILTEELWNIGYLPCYFELDDIVNERIFVTSFHISTDNDSASFATINERIWNEIIHYINFDHVRYSSREKCFYLAYRQSDIIRHKNLILTPIEKLSILGAGNINNELWRIKHQLTAEEYKKVMETIKA